MYTREEIIEYFKKILANDSGVMKDYESLLKYISIDPLEGLIIKGYDIARDSDGNAITESSVVYEPVYSEELGQIIQQPVISSYDDNGNPVYETEEKSQLVESPYSVKIDNTSFSIRNDGNAITTIKGDTMEIEKAEIKTNMRLGNYVFDLTDEKTLNLFYDPIED